MEFGGGQRNGCDDGVFSFLDPDARMVTGLAQYQSGAEVFGCGSPTNVFSSEIQLQIPDWMMTPSLVSGGGVEAGVGRSVSYEAFPPSYQESEPLCRQKVVAVEGYQLQQCMRPDEYAGMDDHHLPAPIAMSPYQPLALTSGDIGQWNEQQTTGSSRFVVPSSNLESSPHLGTLRLPKRTQTLPSLPSSSSSAAVFHLGQGATQPVVPTCPSSLRTASLGLPIYSASGFDLLSILARVATRPFPRVQLGPVDMTCSFVVVDTRKPDHPIVYCSPSFLKLTGYPEEEVLGRNCRFLQRPPALEGGGPQRQEPPAELEHWHEDPALRDSIRARAALIGKALRADKEVQCEIVNYRKDGSAFVNLVTVIPIGGGGWAGGGGGGGGGESDDTDVVFHVGFQVDLSKQPERILEKLNNNSYRMDCSLGILHGGPVGVRGRVATSGSNYGAGSGAGYGYGYTAGHGRERKALYVPTKPMSKELRRLLENPEFLQSFPISIGCNYPPAGAPGVEAGVGARAAKADSKTMAGPSTTTTTTVIKSTDPTEYLGGNSLIHFMLLEKGPDFMLIVSLKGAFMYVAPCVTMALGYEQSELVGKGLVDLVHEEDVVPLMRELKESSTTNGGVAAAAAASGGGGAAGGGGSGSSRTDGLGYENPAGAGPGVSSPPRPVNLFFRARAKCGAYVWIEARGRLHVEPGKGRKAIVLSARASEVSVLRWGAVASVGGLAKRRGWEEGGGARTDLELPAGVGVGPVFQEFWGAMSPSLVVLVVGEGLVDVLGYTDREWLWRNLEAFFVDEQELVALRRGVAEIGVRRRRDASFPSTGDTTRAGYSRGETYEEYVARQTKAEVRSLRCRVRHKDGSVVGVVFNVYRPERDGRIVEAMYKGVGGGVTPAPLIFQARLVGAETYPLGGDRVLDSSLVADEKADKADKSKKKDKKKSVLPGHTPLDLEANMFEEFEVGRNSSWQYEVQQLRNVRKRKEEEVKALEALLKKVRKKKAKEEEANAQVQEGRHVGLEDGERVGRGWEREERMDADADETAYPQPYPLTARCPPYRAPTMAPYAALPARTSGRLGGPSFSDSLSPPAPFAFGAGHAMPCPPPPPQHHGRRAHQINSTHSLSRGQGHHHHHHHQCDRQVNSRSGGGSYVPPLVPSEWPSTVGGSSFVRRIQQEVAQNLRSSGVTGHGGSGSGSGSGSGQRDHRGPSSPSVVPMKRSWGAMEGR